MATSIKRQIDVNLLVSLGLPIKNTIQTQLYGQESFPKIALKSPCELVISQTHQSQAKRSANSPVDPNLRFEEEKHPCAGDVAQTVQMDP